MPKRDRPIRRGSGSGQRAARRLRDFAVPSSILVLQQSSLNPTPKWCPLSSVSAIPDAFNSKYVQSNPELGNVRKGAFIQFSISVHTSLPRTTILSFFVGGMRFSGSFVSWGTAGTAAVLGTRGQTYSFRDWK